MNPIPPAPQPIVAAFDFDGTFIYGDSLFPFLLLTSGPLKFIGNIVMLLPMLVRYALGRYDKQAAKEAILSRFLQGWSRQAIRKAGVHYAHGYLPRVVKPAALTRLRWHQQQGHRCILVSASTDAYLEDWAATLGFDAVLCSRLEYDANERFTGRLAGKNCIGEEKAARIREWLAGPAEIYAYGDSRGDREMLMMAKHAFFRGIPEC